MNMPLSAAYTKRCTSAGLVICLSRLLVLEEKQSATCQREIEHSAFGRASMGDGQGNGRS